MANVDTVIAGVTSVDDSAIAPEVKEASRGRLTERGASSIGEVVREQLTSFLRPKPLTLAEAIYKEIDTLYWLLGLCLGLICYLLILRR